MLNRTLSAMPYVAIALVAAVLVFAHSLPEAATGDAPSIAQERIDSSTLSPVGMVVNWGRTVMAGQRNPESIVWHQMLASRDGSVVCLAYQVRGDGGTLSTERVSYVAGSKGAKRGSWDAACSQGVADVPDAAKLIAMR